MLLVDTGVLLAAADENDPDHGACADLLEAAAAPLMTSPLVVAEPAYLIDRQLGAAAADAAFFRSIARGEFWSRRSRPATTPASPNSSIGIATCHSAAPTPA